MKLSRKAVSALLLISAPGIIFAGLFLKDWIFGLLFIGVACVISRELWHLLPASAHRWYGHQNRFAAIFLICLLFFVYSTSYINYHYLPGITDPSSVVSVLILLTCSTAMGWCWTRKKYALSAFLILLAGLAFFIWTQASDWKFKRVEEPTDIDRIKSLPYITWVADKDNIDKSMVTLDLKALSFDGLNLFACYQSPTAYLVNMAGDILHTWKSPNLNDTWDYVNLDSEGNFYGDVEHQYLVKLDFDSRILWRSRLRVHHDFEIDQENDRIYTLINEWKVSWVEGWPTPILVDSIALLDLNGNLIRTIPLMDILPKDLLEKTWTFQAMYPNFQEYLKTWLVVFSQKLIFEKNYGRHDLTHANKISRLKNDVGEIGKKGDFFVCVRNFHLAMIIDPDTGAMKWSWGPGVLDHPHNATFLTNGHILVFDNGLERGFSRVLEYDPIAQKIVWQYQTDPPQNFHSKIMGSAQRLPNGNTLIAWGTKGYVFEVSPEGQLVWELYSPEVEKEKKLRKSIYGFTRITGETRLPFNP